MSLTQPETYLADLTVAEGTCTIDDFYDPVGEDARLAGAGARDDEERAFGGEDRLALGGVQIREIGLRLGDRHCSRC